MGPMPARPRVGLKFAVKKMSNVLDDIDLEGLERTDILAHFVKYKKTTTLLPEKGCLMLLQG